MSKCNCGSRKRHSIDSALLEKRLILDLSKREEDSFSCTMSDLEAYHDTQLPNIWAIVEEHIGVNRKAMKLVTKVLPRCKHFIGDAHSISKDSQWEMN